MYCYMYYVSSVAGGSNFDSLTSPNCKVIIGACTTLNYYCHQLSSQY